MNKYRNKKIQIDRYVFDSIAEDSAVKDAGENLKKDKMIDLMLEELSNSTINECPYCDYNIDLDCDNRCEDNKEKECWKMYFEKKVNNEI